ncbi:PRC-barrel domain-containing protein [Hyphomonas johnsonii]|uniref:PRC-barrel domain-containing protein n=1 Tax=Hyphomonas johnsonii MHS-2 TaxID=1280950 RepID=A0A059FE92_9PROT|nr:PRC-barrel domain-containing protein [Hyphomonas johnsonii]KCZ88866.1 PRC-barrel domain-containing protein [Hyphomonas johnsonii MHS-2]
MNTMTHAPNSLISSDRVEGTNVYNGEGEKLGSVDCVMLDKAKGNVAYAVMSFGGFLGLGEKRHPLPWQTLNYDEGKEGYVVNMTKEELKSAPTLDVNEYDRLADRTYGASVFSYYGQTPYWTPIA